MDQAVLVPITLMDRQTTITGITTMLLYGHGRRIIVHAQNILSTGHHHHRDHLDQGRFRHVLCRAHHGDNARRVITAFEYMSILGCIGLAEYCLVAI